MAYPRKFLEKVKGKPGFQRVAQELITKLETGDTLTLSEEEFTCGIMNVLRDETGAYKFKTSQIEGCKNYHFRHTYLLYAHDLNGTNVIKNAFGKISEDEKNQDVKFLNKEFEDWKVKITGKKTDDFLFNYLIDECQHQTKILDKYCTKKKILDSQRDYLYRSMVLHSKYIFFLVKEYYQDLGQSEEILHLHDYNILVDPYCYIHTLFRHYAPSVKEYQIDKTYHFDQEIPYKSLPVFFKKIIGIFGRNFSKTEFDGRSINFLFNKKRYVLWFRPFQVPGKGTNYLRLQTFYHADSKMEGRRMRKLRKQKISSKLSILVKYDN